MRNVRIWQISALEVVNASFKAFVYWEEGQKGDILPVFYVFQYCSAALAIFVIAA